MAIVQDPQLHGLFKTWTAYKAIGTERQREKQKAGVTGWALVRPLTPNSCSWGGQNVLNIQTPLFARQSKGWVEQWWFKYRFGPGSQPLVVYRKVEKGNLNRTHR